MGKQIIHPILIKLLGKLKSANTIRGNNSNLKSLSAAPRNWFYVDNLIAYTTKILLSEHLKQQGIKTNTYEKFETKSEHT